jgi:hypothetical protein
MTAVQMPGGGDQLRPAAAFLLCSAIGNAKYHIGKKSAGIQCP